MAPVAIAGVLAGLVVLAIAALWAVARVRKHERQRAALIEELRATSAQLEARAVGLAAADEAVEITDTRGLLEYVNPAWERLTGYSFAEAIGHTPKELLRSDRTDAAVFDQIWDNIQRGKPWRGTFFGRRKDGTDYEVAVSVAAALGESGEPSHYIAVKRDITEERKAAEVLRVNDRMASVGTLAAGVAHEINNPLAYITANLIYVSEVLEALPASDDVREAIEASAEAAMGVERVTEIVKGLRSLSRADEHTVESIDVHELLESCIRMVNTEIRHRAALERDFGDIGPVSGNSARLAQVFINLLVNAAQAIDVGNYDGNRITVRTRPREGGGVEVTITDTGNGMAPEVMARVFDPFFTTKAIGEGTGLGLSICHGILKQMGGDISVDSAPGEGTTFTVLLPEHSLDEPIATGAAEPSGPDRARVLVVDDEPLVGTALRRLLSDCDVTVLTRAAEALRLLATERFDVVLCDVMMPDTSGIDLYERVREKHPGLERKFVFMSGGVFSPRMRDALDNLPAPLLDKPLSRSDVRRLIADLVA